MQITEENAFKDQLETIGSSGNNKKRTKWLKKSDIISASFFFILTNGFIVLSYGYSLGLILTSIKSDGYCMANHSFIPLFTQLNDEHQNFLGMEDKGYDFQVIKPEEHQDDLDQKNFTNVSQRLKRLLIIELIFSTLHVLRGLTKICIKVNYQKGKGKIVMETFKILHFFRYVSLCLLTY